jgi:nitrogen fixation protein NifB
MRQTVRIAVATKGHGQIDLHFGHADAFEVYDIDPDGRISHIGQRQVEHYCQGGFGDEDKREVIIRALADCQGLLVAKIGDGPKNRLAAAGIEASDDFAYGATDEGLRGWFATLQTRTV